MKKNTYLLICLILILLLNACVGTEQNQLMDPDKNVNNKSESAYLDKIVINGSKYLSNAPIMIADAEGFFKEQNLIIEYVPFDSPTSALPLLVTGEIDVWAGSHGSNLMNVTYAESNIRVVADRGYLDINHCAYTALIVRTELYDSGELINPSDYIGLRISSRTSGSGAYMLDKFMAIDGYGIEDLTLSYIPVTSQAEAFANNAFDATLMAEPWITRINNIGNSKTILSIADVIPGYQISVLMFAESLIKDNPEVGVRFMVAYLKGVQTYLEGKTERNIEILIEATGMTRDDLLDSCWPSINANGNINFESLEPFMDWALEAGFLKERLSEDQYWTSYFIDEALKILNN